MKPITKDFILATLLNIPMLFYLAHYPQGPDGAELLMTAMNGGVLHSPGMPLQSWLARVFVGWSATYPAWSLSILSWVGEWVATFALLRALAAFNVDCLARGLTVAAFVFYPVEAMMAVQPEKYTWIAATTAMFMWAAACERTPIWFLSLTVALAISQHTAGVALLLPWAWIVYRRQNIKSGLFGFGLILIVSSLFYMSLLLQRTVNHPWPDWGYLQSASDVWRHFLREDFNFGVSTQSKSFFSGFAFGLFNLNAWAILIFLLPLGLLRVGTRGFVLLGLFASVLILSRAELPQIGEQPFVLGYGERYHLLLLPWLVLLLGFGLQRISEASHLRKVGIGFAIIGVLLSAFVTWPKMRAVDNNLFEIFRLEAGRELPTDALFVSTNDMELFYGIPCETGICFPIKDLFQVDWYRLRAAPAMSSRLKNVDEDIKIGNFGSYGQFLHSQLDRGPLVSTTGGIFLQDSAFEGHLQQKGLVWLATAEELPVYTDEILVNAERLCGEFERVWKSVPEDSQYFMHLPLNQFKYLYLGAGDHLKNTNRAARALKAYAVAEVLQAGVPVQEWRARCVEFAKTF